MKIGKYVIVIFGLCCIMTSGIKAEVTERLTGSKDKVVLWASNPLEKIFKDSPLPNKVNTKGVFLEALRNEYEPAQVCITSSDYQGPVRIKINPLVHLSGKYKISDINARFVGYIPIPKGVPRFPAHPAAYPDPLILDEEVILKPHQTQPVWVTVKVPKDAMPGEYKGDIEVITTTGNTVLPLNLTVYPVTLPETSNFSLGSWGGDTKLAELFGVVAPGQWQKGNYTPEYLDFVKNESIRNRYEHRARVFSDQPFWPHDITKVFWKDGGYVYDYTLLDKLISTVEEGFHNQFRITCIGVVDKTTKANGGELDEKGLLTSSFTVLNSDGSVNPERSFSNISTDDPRYRAFIGNFFKAMSLHLQEKGWLDKVSFKVIDEPTDELIAPVLRLNAYIKQTAPGIRLNTTFWKPDSSAVTMSKAKYIDLSIVTTWTLEVSPQASQAVQEETKKGREFWLYNDPGIVLDKPLIQTRKVGWKASFYGAKGYMHWAYCWKSDPWKDPFDKNLEPGGFGGHFIVYPDMARKKIVDSIRWEMLRETAEDYDTLYLLEKAGGNSRKFVKQVMDLSGSKQDPELFSRIRHELLCELSRLSNEPKPIK